MQGDIVSQGVELMLFGMGTVVIFLTLLILATTVMSRVIARFFPEPEPVAPPAVAPGVAGDDDQLVAVITAAIQQHRADRR